MEAVRIATRESPLAVWQAEMVRDRLLDEHPSLTVELVPMTTRGDQILDRSLQAVGGKALFIKELEQAMLEDRADIAVHSMKDVPADMPAGFIIACALEREEPRDAWVSRRYDTLDALPNGARVGTSSLRRQAQIAHYRPDLEIAPLRGNVGTRLAKLDADEFDGIVLACAGLLRLGLEGRIRQRIPAEISVPAVGQGIVGVECREGDPELARILECLEDLDSRRCLDQERVVSRRLGGSCHVPLAAYAEPTGDGGMRLTSRVGCPDGTQMLHIELETDASEADSLGDRVSERLLDAGAGRILAELDSGDGGVVG